MDTAAGKPKRWTLTIQVVLAFTALSGLSLSMFRIANAQSHSLFAAGLFAFFGFIFVGLAIGMVGGQLWSGTRAGQFRGAVIGGLLFATPFCGWMVLPFLLYAIVIWRIEKKRSASAGDSQSKRRPIS